MKLSPWTRPQPSEFTRADTDSRVRYPDPLDGRTWDLDGTPRWIALVSVCCGPTPDQPNRPYHYDWSVDHSTPEKRERQGATVRTTFADALQEADRYMESLGWELG